jgi:hypothetical protein
MRVKFRDHSICLKSSKNEQNIQGIPAAGGALASRNVFKAIQAHLGGENSGFRC